MTQRPKNFENLLRDGSLKEADRNDDEIQQFVTVATDAWRDARNAALAPHNRYMMAYDGLHSLATAVLLHHGTRPGDGRGHRHIALQLFASKLALTPGEFKILADAHDRRNGITYRSPLPPLTHKDAEGVIAILATALPRTIAVVDGSAPDSAPSP